MKSTTRLLAVAVSTLIAASACGGSDSTDGLSQPSGGSSGTSGSGGSTGGSGGQGGDAGAAGSGGGAGTAGSGGGAGTAGSGGATAGAGGGEAFWSQPYNPNGTPNPASGEHNAGKDCITCHAAGDEVWAFGGTIHESDGTTGAAHVEVAVRDANGIHATYSGANGNFWVPGPLSIDWPNAEVRMRNANGEKQMFGEASPHCNQCHTGGMVLIEP